MPTIEHKKILHLHIVMRTGSIHFEKIQGNLIEEHNKIAQKRGFVYLGKAGRRMAETKMTRVADNIKEYAASKFIVVFREQSTYKGYAAPLLQIAVNTEFTPKEEWYPNYYKNIIRDVTMWFKIGIFEPVPEHELANYRLALNNNSLIGTLRNCRTSLLLIHSTR